MIFFNSSTIYYQIYILLTLSIIDFNPKIITIFFHFSKNIHYTVHTSYIKHNFYKKKTQNDHQRNDSYKTKQQKKKPQKVEHTTAHGGAKKGSEVTSEIHVTRRNNKGSAAVGVQSVKMSKRCQPATGRRLIVTNVLFACARGLPRRHCHAVTRRQCLSTPIWPVY